MGRRDEEGECIGRRSTLRTQRARDSILGTGPQAGAEDDYLAHHGQYPSLEP